MSSLGSTAEQDEYRRWVSSHGYRVELAALILSTAPHEQEYVKAELIVRALDGEMEWC